MPSVRRCILLRFEFVSRREASVRAPSSLWQFCRLARLGGLLWQRAIRLLKFRSCPLSPVPCPRRLSSFPIPVPAFLHALFPVLAREVWDACRGGERVAEPLRPGGARVPGWGGTHADQATRSCGKRAPRGFRFANVRKRMRCVADEQGSMAGFFFVLFFVFTG